MLINTVILALINEGITVRRCMVISSVVESSLPGVEKWYEVDGFYKSSHIYICEHEGELHNRDRYGEGCTFNVHPNDPDPAFSIIEELCFINIRWLEISLKKGATTGPHRDWIPLLVSYGLLKQHVETKVSYTITG